MTSQKEPLGALFLVLGYNLRLYATSTTGLGLGKGLPEGLMRLSQLMEIL